MAQPLANYSGTLHVLAHLIQLFVEDEGFKDLRDVFLDQNKVATTQTETIQLGGGNSYTRLVWPDADSDDHVPGLKSLLAYLAEQPTGNVTNNYQVLRKALHFSDGPQHLVQKRTEVHKHFNDTQHVQTHSVHKHIKHTTRKALLEPHFHQVCCPCRVKLRQLESRVAALESAP